MVPPTSTKNLSDRSATTGSYDCEGYQVEIRVRNTHSMKVVFSLLFEPHVEWLVASEAFL